MYLKPIDNSTVALRSTPAEAWELAFRGLNPVAGFLEMVRIDSNADEHTMTLRTARLPRMVRRLVKSADQLARESDAGSPKALDELKFAYTAIGTITSFISGGATELS